MTSNLHARRPQQGAILVFALMLLVLMSLTASNVLLDTSLQQKRRNEEELLFVGEQYRQAIESYRRNGPTRIRQFPTKMEDLVADNRFPQPRRHLRKLFKDPTNPKGEWVLIKVGNAIVGVHSQSTDEPYKKAGFTDTQRDFASANSYAGWLFKVDAPALAASQSSGVSSSGNTPTNTLQPIPIGTPGR
jgi:type II secretory pathway pseudopilin PulG